MGDFSYLFFHLKKNLLKSKKIHAKYQPLWLFPVMGLWAIYILSFTFLFSEKAWNMEHIDHKSENKTASLAVFFTFTPCLV